MYSQFMMHGQKNIEYQDVFIIQTFGWNHFKEKLAASSMTVV